MDSSQIRAHNNSEHSLSASSAKSLGKALYMYYCNYATKRHSKTDIIILALQMSENI